MKTKILFVMLMILTTGIASQAQISKAEIVATGLTCSMCSNAINKQLKALPEIENVSTDLNTNTFIVQFKKGSAISPIRLKQSVEKAGFFIGSLIITVNLDNPNLDENWSTTQNEDTYIFVEAASKTVSGQCMAKVIDKGFVTQKEYKKLSKSLTKYPNYVAGTEKVYHLKLI